MADPFAITLAAPEQAPTSGFMGVSPDTWRNLMLFGANLSTAANARGPGGFLTYGGGLAGPLGAATQNTMAQAQDFAKQRQQMALGQQQLTTAQLQNQLTRMQIPLLGVKLQAAQDFLNDAGNTGTPTLPQAPTDTDYTNRVWGAEGMGKNPRSSANGYGQFTNGTWLDFAQANPQYFPNMAPQQILAQRETNQDAARAATVWLANKNAPILQANGVQPTDGAKGLAHFLGPQVAANMWKADPNASAAAIIQASLPADQAQAYLTANPQLARQTAGQVTAQYRAWDGGARPQVAAAPAPSAGAAVAHPASDAGGGGAAPPNQMLQQAEAMFAKARRGAAAGIEVGPLVRQAQTLYETALAGDRARLAAEGALDANIRQKLGEQGFQILPDGTYSIIPGGPADPKVQGAQASAKPLEVRPGGVVVQNGKAIYAAPLSSEEVAPNGAKNRVFRDPLSGREVGQSIPVEISPEDRAYATERGKSLAQQREKIDHDATAAKDTNYLFDNLRNDSRSWDMGKFANIEGQARQYLSAIAQTFGIAAPQLNEKLGDYEAFAKSSGMLLRTAVHDVSSRAAVQEYNLIAQTLPSPTSSRQGFLRVADQWQALNDYRIAKQQFAQNYTGSPSNFNVDFNSQVSPTAFLLNRMSQTPEGQHDMQTMIARMQETPEGRAQIERMNRAYQFAKQSGLFGTQ